VHATQEEHPPRPSPVYKGSPLRTFEGAPPVADALKGERTVSGSSIFVHVEDVRTELEAQVAARSSERIPGACSSSAPLLRLCSSALTLLLLLFLLLSPCPGLRPRGR
jgi:hypothetical protein